MPIKADYTWTEKKDTVKVVIPLKGISASKVDVFVSVSTLKVNFSPYILDIVLFKEVDSVKHKATVKDGNLLITLCKKEIGIWGCFEVEGTKEVLKAVKNEALAQHAALNQDLSQQRSDRKLAEEKHSLRTQMKLEEMERTRVENLKQEEKEAAEKEVYETFAQMRAKDSVKSAVSTKSSAASQKKQVTFGEPSATPAPAQSSIDEYLDADDIDDDIAQPAPSKKQISDQIDEEHSGAIDSTQNNDHTIFQDEAADEEVRYIPPPRSSGLSENADQKIGISFTPRVFPTPMRESKAAEEEDWVAKNRRHLKKHGVLGKNQSGDVSEEDPVWLKAKGDDFFRSGDVRSALNAYSAALDADPQMLPCLANRSVCYLRLSLPAECKADCTAALQLLATDAEKNDPASAGMGGSMEVKLLMRRGTASCQLGLFTEALTDYHQARVRYEQLPGAQISALSGVSLESLAADIVRLKLLSDAEGLKKEGDALMAERDTTAAHAKYTAALALVPVHVSCLSNRSACRLAVQDVKGCVDDCTAAITLLTVEDATSTPTKETQLTLGGTGGDVQRPEQLKTMLLNILPAVGSVKRTSWLVKTLLRRGVAYAQLSRFDEAVQDYRRASALDPTNEAIKADLQRMIEARDRELQAAGGAAAAESGGGPVRMCLE